MIELKKIWPYILIGILVRIIISATTFHPDVKILSFTQAVFLQEHNLNPYEFFSGLSSDDPRKQIYKTETPDDLPLQYFIRLPLEAVTRLLVNPETEKLFLLDSSSLFGNFQIYPYLFLVKLPLIIFDLALGFLLSLAVAKELRKKAILVWMFNPMTLWATSAIGQVDILPTFFVVLAVVFLQRKKLNLTALSLGLGGAIKSFPFLLLPYLIFLEKSWMNRIKLVIISFIPWIISVIPFLSSPDFRHNALFAPQLDKMLYAKFPLSGGESIFLTIGILIGFYLFYVSRKRTAEDFISFSTATLLVVLGLTHFHIQWFLWVTPFLLLSFLRPSSESVKLSLILLFFSVVLMLFLFESSLQMNLFSPLLPSLNRASGLAEILSSEKLTFMKNLAASVFASSALFLIYHLLLRKND